MAEKVMIIIVPFQIHGEQHEGRGSLGIVMVRGVLLQQMCLKRESFQ